MTSRLGMLLGAVRLGLTCVAFFFLFPLCWELGSETRGWFLGDGGVGPGDGLWDA